LLAASRVDLLEGLRVTEYPRKDPLTRIADALEKMGAAPAPDDRLRVLRWLTRASFEEGFRMAAPDKETADDWRSRWEGSKALRQLTELFKE
jgi:hypothetical protein